MTPTQIGKLRAMNSLVLAIPCVLLATFLFAPVSYLRPRLDLAGHPIVCSDGRPAMERDWPTELREQWVPYSCLALGAFFIVRAAFIRFRPFLDLNQMTAMPNHALLETRRERIAVASGGFVAAIAELGSLGVSSCSV